MVRAEAAGRDSSKPLSDSAREALSFRCAVARDAGGKQDPGKCEDAIPVLKEVAGGRILLAVADGLGGYARGFDHKSGGQIASATAIEAAVDYVSGLESGQVPDRESLTNFIFKQLRHLAETRLPPSRVRGSLGRHQLATTLALAIVDREIPDIASTIRYYWIGDSRIYFLDAEGLHQLSRDDNLAQGDAFAAIFDPPPMSQFLAASMEREWRIHEQQLALDLPGLLILCTDGCYVEWGPPWRFEAALQEALEKSGSFAEWIARFQAMLETRLSDDASMVAYPINLSGFAEFKELRARQSGVLAQCLKAEQEKRLSAAEIWSSIYRPVYENVPAAQKGATPGKVIVEPRVLPLEESDRTTVTDPVKSKASVKPRTAPVARLYPSALLLGMTWLAGFLCGLPFGEKVMAWLEFFWRWFRSLWQST
ncbi:MAG: PP2C family protein-serine/threonine phosphatase [Gammaproteobacteria bacterium]